MKNDDSLSSILDEMIKSRNDLENNLTSEQMLQKDLEYIKNEKMCENKQGLLCKYCTIIHAVTIYNHEKEKYVDYWKKKYKNLDEQKIIEDACYEKFKNLMSVDEMIDLVNKSHDRKDEKLKIIKSLRG